MCLRPRRNFQRNKGAQKRKRIFKGERRMRNFTEICKMAPHAVSEGELGQLRNSDNCLLHLHYSTRIIGKSRRSNQVTVTCDKVIARYAINEVYFQ